jgi:putative ATPase
MDTRPLAERMRPDSLEAVVGQSHLVGAGKIIHEIITAKQPTSLILWGPPGSGKTTLARIIARQTEAEYVELSAVTSGKADVQRVVARAEQNQRLGMRTILFVDEIHRFNKAQQDAFLPHVEDGTIILIGATTENPNFEVISPLLSRSRVLVLEPLTKDDIVAILQKAIKQEKLKVGTKSIDLLAELSGGDARVALGNLELALQLAGSKPVTPEVIKTAAQKRVPGYDKAGEQHYNIISAFILRACVAATRQPPCIIWRACCRLARTRNLWLAAWSSLHLKTSGSPRRPHSTLRFRPSRLLSELACRSANTICFTAPACWPRPTNPVKLQTP